MAADLFDQLAETKVPPPPERFDDRLHRRLNRVLLTLHFVELVLSALPHVAMHVTRPVWGWIRLTITGRLDPPEDRRDK